MEYIVLFILIMIYDLVTKTSDLYRLSNNHLTLIYKDIADWYSPLNKVKEES